MPILATGNTFATGDNVTAAMLNASVNSATFATGAVDDATTQLSGGAIIVKDGGITPAKLSTGGLSWTVTGAHTITGTLSVTGATTITGALSATGGINSTSIGATTPSTAVFSTLTATGATTLGVAATGANVTIKEYTTGSQRDWGIRDDSGVNRLRFSRGGSDYAFWDVTKVAASDNISGQIWSAVTDYSWKVNGTQRMFLDTNGLTLSGTVINAANLPTSAAGLSSGDLWVDTGASNVVKRVP